jgi:cell division protein FtsL
MKKLVLLIIFVLILATSLVKNSTKEIEDKIFILNESIRSLKVEFSDVMLEYNFLSSPDKLIQYQSQYFEKDLIKINIMKIKEITEKNNIIELTDFIKKIDNHE